VKIHRRRIIFLLGMVAALLPIFGGYGSAAAAQGLDPTVSEPPLVDRTTISGDPRLTEATVKQKAARIPGVASVLEDHPELELHVTFASERRVWTIFWTLPNNFRHLLTVDIDDSDGTILFTNIESEAYFDPIPAMSEQDAIDLAGSQFRVQDEIAGKEVSSSADYGTDLTWTVSYMENGNDVAQVLIDDDTGAVNEIRTGPQVLWQMARGYDGAFGRIVNKAYVWLPLCLLFLLPFFNFRKPFRLLHLDLIVLLSFTVSHYYFNRGEIFTSVPLAYPPLVYLFIRLAWIGFRRRRRQSPSRLPQVNFGPKLMLAGLIVIVVFRLVINIADSNVVDVGYSGVIGANLIQDGRTPYGNMPADDGNGDTYGPLNYLVYVPFERVLNWSGGWDDLPAAHATAIFFDLVAMAGMYAAGRRLMPGRPQEGNRLGLALAYGWAAFPYTTFVLSCNVNDGIVAAFLIWGLVFIRSAPVAGLILGLATQIKFFPAMLVPLWASFPRALFGWGRRLLFIAGFGVAILVTLPVIFMGEGSFHTFWDRSIAWQIGRDSPFSIWGQHQDALAGLQRVGHYLLAAVAVLVYFLPLKKTMAGVAAMSAMLVIGFQLLQTHWFYLYIPWFFPLAFIAIMVTGPAAKIERSWNADNGTNLQTGD